MSQNDPFWDELIKEPEFKEISKDREKHYAEIMKRIKEDEKKKIQFGF